MKNEEKRMISSLRGHTEHPHRKKKEVVFGIDERGMPVSCLLLHLRTIAVRRMGDGCGRLRRLSGSHADFYRQGAGTDRACKS